MNTQYFLLQNRLQYTRRPFFGQLLLLLGNWLPRLASLMLVCWLMASPVAAKHVQELLLADGTVNLATGFSGSIDVSGFSIELDPQRGPVFQRIDPTPTGWSPLGVGTGNIVRALAVMGSNLYVGGNFTDAGGSTINRIAKWDGTSWSALGSGVNGEVYALAVMGNNLYAGGDFTNAGGTAVNHIAKWNTTSSSWSALGAGVSGSFTSVLAMAVINSDLYVGGVFTNAGGAPASYIAKWNETSSSWSALGEGVDGSVWGLAVMGNDLYVGGTFTTSGGVSASRIAKWDGTSWSALGSGVNKEVFALAVMGNDLYVGGKFTTAGGASANRIAKWDGTNWSALEAGIADGQVNALIVISTDLYVGGGFFTAGGNLVNYIAKWNGTSWSALETGTEGAVNALAVIGNKLYAGGGFQTAGSTSARYVASYVVPCAVSISPPSSTITSGGSVTLTASGSDSYAWSTGESTTAITLSNVTSTTAFTLTGVTGECSATATATVSVTQPTPLALTASAGLVCVGNSSALSVSTTGGLQPYSYTWVAPANASVSGSTNLSTVSASASASGTYTFTVTVADASTMVSSLTVNLTANTPPGITAQPVAGSVVCAGSAVSVPVSATGSNLTYQWYKGSTPVASQTAATLSLPASTTNDAGSYSVVVANGGCPSVTSTAFSLTVVDGVSITAQPTASSAVCVGMAVSVPASVSGSALGQQWYKDGSAVASQTATTLSLPSPTTTDAGSYELVIQTSSCGSLTSSAFSLSVNAAPGITAQPAARSVVCGGSAVSVPVSATGSNLSYQWYKGSTPVASQTAATLSLPTASTTDAGSYLVVVANSGCQSVTSTAFSLTVNTAPTVSISPSSITLIGGESTTLTASGASSYSWSTGSSQTTIVVSPVDDTVYSVTGISNGCSGTATATVSVTCGEQVLADAISTTVTQALSPGNCAVSLRGTGYGTSYIVTGPDGYVFSAVYRKVGNYTLNALKVKLPGTYTFTVSYADACGRASSDTMTYVITGEACK